MSMPPKKSASSAPVGTILITGISASGKSTMGSLLEDGLKRRGISNVKLIDGEFVRDVLAQQGKHFGFSTEERNHLSIECAKIALDFNLEGDISIICAIAHVKKKREKMREILGHMFEVYLDCSVEACVKRDYKGHYKKALNGEYGNFTGVTHPYEKSEHPDLVLNTEECSAEECSQKLLKAVLKFLDSR